MQQFHDKVDKVAGRDFHEHHHWLEPEPPDDPEVSAQCPQCRRLTWRHSRHCIHCKLDVFAWNAKRHRIVVRRRLHRFAAVLAGLSLTSAGVAYFAGRPVETFAFAISIILAVLAVKTMDSASR